MRARVWMCVLYCDFAQCLCISIPPKHPRGHRPKHCGVCSLCCQLCVYSVFVLLLLFFFRLYNARSERMDKFAGNTYHEIRCIGPESNRQTQTCISLRTISIVTPIVFIGIKQFAYLSGVVSNLSNTNIVHNCWRDGETLKTNR